MTSFVLDASVTLAWVLDNPVPVYALGVRQELFRGRRGLVPALWHLEIANGLAMAERRRDLSAADVTRQPKRVMCDRGPRRELFASLGRLQRLSPAMVALPAHASEPIAFDGQAVAAQMGGIVTWLSGWLESEAAFVDRVTSQLPPTPPNFVRIVDLNEAGEFPTGDPTELEAGANRCAVR